MKKLLIIDGNSILNRAYYGIRMLNAPDGTPTNAVFGFLNILFKNLEEYTPDYLCVAFDVKEKTFRHKMYDLYKAQRKPAPEDFLVQIPLIKSVLSAMGCVCLEKAGYEADDIIGTVSRICEEEGVECSILTGDKDDLQLASELVKIKLVISRMGSSETTIFGSDEVFEKYGVTPHEFIAVKALMGDSSDNIPGVRGIGEKTAFSLIGEHKSLDALYDNLETAKLTPSVKKKLEDGKDAAYLSYTLATIDRYIPIDFCIDDCKFGEYDRGELAELFLKLNFRSFLGKLDLLGAAGDEKCPEVMQFDGECEFVSADELLSATAEKSVTYRLICENGGFDLAVTVDGERFLYLKNAENSTLQTFFGDKARRKGGFGIKDDIIKLHKAGVDFRGIEFDSEIAAYILESARTSYDIESLALEFFGISLSSGAKEEENGQISLAFDDDSEKYSRCAEELFVLFGLKRELSKRIENDGQHDLYYNVELPLVEVLADMQITGVCVDKTALEEFGNELREGIAEYEKRIYEYAGCEFNINSPKQLGNILFSELELPHGKKTKTGYSTSVDVLKKLVGVHPIAECILEYRSLAKLCSTYVDGLLPVISPKTGRIHSNFNQTVTATGRISSAEPNLQNIPVRTPRGRLMRKMFVAEGDRVLVDADYSQIELRILAHLSGDETMRRAFVEGIDIHTQTASEVFRVPIESVTPEMRTKAKAVNFGIVYGIGEFSLAQDLKISMREAKQYIADYLDTYPAIKKFMTETVESGKHDGFVTTILKRRRYLPELRSGNKITQAFGERAAMNAPVQGSAADVIKIAMVNVFKRLKKEGLKSKLILQVHDELIVEAEPEETARVGQILTEEMENAVSLTVPLKVDMNCGRTWYDTK